MKSKENIDFIATKKKLNKDLKQLSCNESRADTSAEKFVCYCLGNGTELIIDNKGITVVGDNISFKKCNN